MLTASFPPEMLQPTRQNTLRISRMIYDLIGIISPLILQFTLIFNKTCNNKDDWENELPSNHVLLSSETYQRT